MLNVKRNVLCLAWLLLAIGTCYGGEQLNIIPTPKEMKIFSGRTAIHNSNTLIVLGKGADKKSTLGADEINKKMSEIGGQPLSIIREGAAADSGNKNLIVIGTPEENSLVKKYLEQTKENIPGEKQGYVIVSHQENSRTVYLLSGEAPEGVLYACVSFRHLLQRDETGAYALNAKIKDWPDYSTRGIFLAADFKNGHERHLPYLDWALHHKCNFVAVDLWSVSNGNYTIPDDPKVIDEIKKFNEYADARGIVTIGHSNYWNLGYLPADKGKPEFKGCTESGKGYWCLCRDELIKAKAEKAAIFLRNSGFKRILFHSRDGSPTAYWSACSGCCKARFGEDRAGADANFINIMYETVRKEISEAQLFFVAAPYYGNIDIPENKPYKEYFTRLTAIIPEDVYLVNASWDRESQDSWKKVIRQPIYQWRNLMMDTWHSGHDFSTMPCLAVKTGYYPDSRDIAFPNIHIGPGRLEIFPLMSAEFMWNVDAPGSFMLESDVAAKPEKQIENLYRYPVKKINGMPYEEWLWAKSSVEPEEVAYGLLPRLCEEAFGKDAAPMMSEILRMGVARGVLLMNSPIYRAAAYYKYVHNADVIKTQYQNAEKAVEKLTEYQKSGKDFRKLEGFFRDMKLAAIGGKSHYYLLAAEEYIKTKELSKAQELLKQAAANLQNEEKNFGKWEFARLTNVSKAMEALSFRIAILEKAGKSKPSGIKVGIYNPNEVGGRVFGEMPVYSTLLAADGISPEFIPTLDNIFQYDCVIIPDCKKLGTKDQGSFLIIEKEIHHAEQKLRDYVLRDGKGLLFYHDSVGLERFAMGKPVFPELCLGTKRVDGTQLTINAVHPVGKGLKKGESFTHMYFDHIQMKPGGDGVAVAVDQDGMAVVIAGELGKGRVVLNGTIIFDNHAAPVREVVGVDKALLVNTVLWLSGKK